MGIGHRCDGCRTPRGLLDDRREPMRKGWPLKPRTSFEQPAANGRRSPASTDITIMLAREGVPGDRLDLARDLSSSVGASPQGPAAASQRSMLTSISMRTALSRM
jgi:hypothetical protein